jgi:hypothetical protein
MSAERLVVGMVVAFCFVQAVTIDNTTRNNATAPAD